VEDTPHPDVVRSQALPRRVSSTHRPVASLVVHALRGAGRGRPLLTSPEDAPRVLDGAEANAENDEDGHRPDGKETHLLRFRAEGLGGKAAHLLRSRV
jgi:hypothetical protein